MLRLESFFLSVVAWSAGLRNSCGICDVDAASAQRLALASCFEFKFLDLLGYVFLLLELAG